MIIFLESPWPILLIGIPAEIVLAILLWRTGQGKMLWAMLGTAAVVVLGLLIEWLVVTDREAITDAIYDGAAAIEANDQNRLLMHVSPGVPDLRADVRWVLDRFEFTMVRVVELGAIDVKRSTNPPTAQAKLRAMGTGRDRKGEVPYQGFDEVVTVEFRLEGNRWLAFAVKPEKRELNPKPR
jgi:hypothetical protein